MNTLTPRNGFDPPDGRAHLVSRFDVVAILGVAGWSIATWIVASTQGSQPLEIGPRILDPTVLEHRAGEPVRG